MNWVIRPAKPDDAPAIADISNTLIRETLVTFNTVEKTPQELAETIAAQGERFLVGVQGDQVIGFANYFPFRGGPGYRHTQELTIHLAPAARRQGLGRGLIARLIAVARADGVHVLVSGISSANPNAIAFHAAQGFTEVGRMPEVGRKWDQWLDLVLMQKRLDGPA